jgi:hypothetical protein
MKRSLTTILVATTLLFSCHYPAKKIQEAKSASLIDTVQKDRSAIKSPDEDSISATYKEIKPVLGYRFIVSGDFDGDGVKENLTEHYFSRLDHKETNKFYEGIDDYDQSVALTVKKEPYSFVISDNNLIDTLHISSEGQHLGLSYLKNEGDLNGDGTDEISYVVNWADYSNMNTWHIVTYKNKKWTELYSFLIWDWQIPDLPETFSQNGPFGLENKIINTKNDTVNERLELELKEFKGLVKKVGTNKIRVTYRKESVDGDVEDTKIVNLKRLK